MAEQFPDLSDISSLELDAKVCQGEMKWAEPRHHQAGMMPA